MILQEYGSRRISVAPSCPPISLIIISARAAILCVSGFMPGLWLALFDGDRIVVVIIIFPVAWLAQPGKMPKLNDNINPCFGFLCPNI